MIHSDRRRPTYHYFSYFPGIEGRHFGQLPSADINLYVVSISIYGLEIHNIKLQCSSRIASFYVKKQVGLLH